MLVKRPVRGGLRVRAVQNPVTLADQCTVVDRHVPCSYAGTARDSIRKRATGPNQQHREDERRSGNGREPARRQKGHKHLLGRRRAWRRVARARTPRPPTQGTRGTTDPTRGGRQPASRKTPTEAGSHRHHNALGRRGSAQKSRKRETVESASPRSPREKAARSLRGRVVVNAEGLRTRVEEEAALGHRGTQRRDPRRRRRQHVNAGGQRRRA